MKYKIYNKVGEFLGIICGSSAEDAIREAILFQMTDAFRAEKIDPVVKGRVIIPVTKTKKTREPT